jgi:hypothetical protein
VQPKLKHKYLFWLTLLILFCFYNYPSTLFFRPHSMHQWGQCDRASIALNYYKESSGFLNPSVNNLYGDGTGKGVSEMPLIQYIVAQGYKIIGFHEWLYRLLEIIILSAGLYFLFLLFHLHLKNFYLCLAGTVLVFTSPTLVFYGNNFLTDVPSFSFVLIGWYFFFLFIKNNNSRHLFVSFFAFTLASLLKISSMISVIAIAGIYLLEFIPKVQFGSWRKIFANKIFPLVCFIIFLVCVGSWYAYSRHYNFSHDNAVFLIGTRTFWNCTNKLFVWNAFYKDILPTVFHYYFLIILAVLFLYLILSYKRNSILWNYLLLSIFIGVLSLFLLFYESYRLHDYYLVAFLILPVFVLLSFFQFIENHYKKLLQSKVFIAAACLILFFNIFYASLKNTIRYFPPKEKKLYEIFVSKEELGLWRWWHWHYGVTLKAFETIEPYNRSLGIKRDDIVLSIPDASFNISLYLMDQKGYTLGKVNERTRKVLTERILKKDVKYIFVSDEETKNHPDIMPFLKWKIGNYKNIDIYRADKAVL